MVAQFQTYCPRELPIHRLESAIPSSFVPPFHEKLRQRVDHGGQARTGRLKNMPTRTKVPGFYNL
jgi:hypothetical protein